jgi:type II secretory pathway pseudopilin PulG
MSPSLRDPRATLLLDIAGLRERFPEVFRSREMPLAEFSPDLLTARALRVEAADDGADRSLLRWTTHFADPAAAQASVDAQRASIDRGLPASVMQLLEREFADHPHRDQMLSAMSRAYTTWARGMMQPRVVGPDVTYEMRFDAVTAAMVVGTLSAVAIPAFTRYVKRTKVAEARSNVTALARAVVAHWDAQPRARRRLITAIPRTPPLSPGANRLTDPPGTWDAVPWRALQFRIEGAHYYVYDVQSDGRTTFTVRAQGDLDGDGVLSSLSITGHVAPAGTITLDPMRVVDELE